MDSLKSFREKWRKGKETNPNLMSNRPSTNVVYQEKCRVILIGIGNNTDEEKDSFCVELSSKYSIERPLLKKIVDQCPIVIKKNVTRHKAESLARLLKSFGAQVTVEVKRDSPPISLEFQKSELQPLALESASLRRNHGGGWTVIGRAKNIGSETLNDIWVLIQLFGDFDEFLTFEEVPLALNPFPQAETAPFKAIFEGDLSIQKISITFKNASGMPLAALERRAKPEWIKVDFDEGDEAVMSIVLTRPSRPSPLEPRNDEIKRGTSAALPSRDVQASKTELIPVHAEAADEVVSIPSQKHLEDSVLDTVSQIGEGVKTETDQTRESPFKTKKEDIAEGRIEAKTAPVEELPRLQSIPLPPFSLPSLEKTEEKTEEKGLDRVSEMNGDRENQPVPFEAPFLDASAFEEASRLIQEISEKDHEREGEPVPFPWVEEFRKSIETYFKKHPDPFWCWFQSQQEKNEFKDGFHSLLTILIHARFDQTDEPLKALENTQRVFTLALALNTTPAAIPALEGTGFFTGDQWRELFSRALPKLQQVCHGILERRAWEAVEIQRLIQVIPHMSEKSSRKSVRWISDLTPAVVDIDLAGLPVSINENVYRVACRLGGVDPHFDVYQGRMSMGDRKIQALAVSAFPKNPSRIEDPMTWIGRAEEGGHCLPVEPHCEGCPFEAFCQRLYLHFNPSEKGMSHR
jgi:hypothetical protein